MNNLSIAILLRYRTCLKNLGRLRLSTREEKRGRTYLFAAIKTAIFFFKSSAVKFFEDSTTDFLQDHLHSKELPLYTKFSTSVHTQTLAIDSSESIGRVPWVFRQRQDVLRYVQSFFDVPPVTLCGGTNTNPHLR